MNWYTSFLVVLALWIVLGFAWFVGGLMGYDVPSARRNIFNHLVGGPLVWMGWLFFWGLSVVAGLIDRFNAWLDAE